MKRIQIERRPQPTALEFTNEYLRGEGRPVILIDALRNWPALTKWSFESFRADFSSDFVLVHRDAFTSGDAKLTKLSSYIEHIETQSESPPGFWVAADGNPLAVEPASNGLPLYLMNWGAFERHAHLLADIRPAPTFVDDWSLALDSGWQEIVEWVCGKVLTALYVGPAGTLSRLHQDFGGTHSYLAQIAGSKRVSLFSPSDGECLYEGAINPDRPDLTAFPRLAEATCHQGIIGPGDLLFTPPNWWHEVRAVEPSITVSHNFFNNANFGKFLTELFANLPRLIDGLNKFPHWRERLTFDPSAISLRSVAVETES